MLEAKEKNRMVPAICSCRAAPGRMIIEPTCPFHGDDPFMADLPDNEIECGGCGLAFIFDPTNLFAPVCPDCGQEEYIE